MMGQYSYLLSQAILRALFRVVGREWSYYGVSGRGRATTPLQDPAGGLLIIRSSGLRAPLDGGLDEPSVNDSGGAFALMFA